MDLNCAAGSESHSARGFDHAELRRSGSMTPATRPGLTEHRLSVDEVLAERLHPSRVELPQDRREMDEERVPTRHVERMRTHELRHAA